MDFSETAPFALKETKSNQVSSKVFDPKPEATPVVCQEKGLPAAISAVEPTLLREFSLCAIPDSLLPEEVVPGLSAGVFGQKNYLYYLKIDSTNNLARSLALEGYPEGTVVVAEMQTGGRGRRGRTWFSPARQGIYFSVILRPAIPLRQISRVSLLAAVAVAETLEEQMNLQPSIKWPNDILINRRKIAGILSETVARMHSVEYLVLGIGLNINHSIQDFPENFATPPTSTLAESGSTCSRSKILQALLTRLDYHYKEMLKGNFSQTLAKAKSKSAVIGQEVCLDTLNGIVVGRAVNLDDNGFLLVRDQKGIIHTVMSGEIFLSHPDIGKFREY